MTQETRMAVWLRDGGKCLRCGTMGTQVHHRQRRQVGGHGLHNLVLLCARCHHEQVHQQPARARAEGFIVSSYTRDVATMPVKTYRGVVLLKEDGTYSWV